MGIKNLLQFLSKYPDLIKEKTTNDFYGKKIAIDISLLIYQIVIGIRSSGSDLTNKKGDITSHIFGLFNKTLAFLEIGIIPIYVFDGKPSELKNKTLISRRKKKDKALEKLAKADNNIDRIRYFKRSFRITKEHLDQCRELLNTIGIPYIDAEEEADSELSYLCKSNMVYAVHTEDMDILTFGSPRIIRNLSSNKKKPIEIELVNILDKLNFTHEQFIELCVLFGCDYCPNIIGINFSKIFEIYCKHKNIENTLIEIKATGYSCSNILHYINAKNYFMNPIHKQIHQHQLKIKKPRISKIIKLLVKKYGFSYNKTINKITKLNQFYYRFKNIL